MSKIMFEKKIRKLKQGPLIYFCNLITGTGQLCAHLLRPRVFCVL